MNSLPYVPAIGRTGFCRRLNSSLLVTAVRVPAKTPDGGIARMSYAIAKSLADPATRERMGSTNTEPLFLGGAGFSRNFREEIAEGLQSSAAVWECGSDRLVCDCPGGPGS